ncbi:FecR domain-containing protein [Sphingobacterium suaedae]|uniref:FecR domain-containing protein n=1 Tax=Sphingobacterium suaedae TaxID=1686402 RepID=A0ABW5KHB5_9SPHI
MKRDWIIRYVQGELSPEESAQVERWIQQKTEYKKKYLEMKKLWEMSSVLKETPDVDVDRAWETFVDKREERLKKKMGPVRSLRQKKILWINAAVSAGILGLLSIWFFKFDASKNVFLKTGEQTQQAQLPDGSSVALNRHTHLKYRKGVFDENRRVLLQQGEAFFNVKRDESRPFIIKSGNTQITVLGTSFHVRRAESLTEVIVASGAVRVSYADKQLILKPHQMVTISDTSKHIVAIDTVRDQLYRYYIHQEFIFDHTPLVRVFATLGKAYDVKFKIDNPETAKLPLTATFEQQSLSDMLKVIVRTFDLSVEKRGNTYHIK